MFVVRTERTALGTPFAQDALARVRAMTRIGDEPVVTTVGGKVLHPTSLERWIATVPRSGCRVALRR